MIDIRYIIDCWNAADNCLTSFKSTKFSSWRGCSLYLLNVDRSLEYSDQ